MVFATLTILRLTRLISCSRLTATASVILACRGTVRLVFSRLVPGDDAGWVSKTWKRPSYYFDMPRLIGDAGRASPTGVVCYNGTQFPMEYDDAIFLGDWTFGRVLVCRRVWKTGAYLPPEDFLLPKDSFGFPVTDLAVATDGSLLISVGGRGTEGGVWRVTSKTKRTRAEESLGEYIWDRRTAFRQDLVIEDAIERASKALEGDKPDVQVDALASLLVVADELDVQNHGVKFSNIVKSASFSDDSKVIGATFRLIKAMCVDEQRIEMLGPCPDSDALNNRRNLLVLAASRRYVEDPPRLISLLLSRLGGTASKFSFPDDVACRLAEIVLGGVGESEGLFSSITANDPVKLPEAKRREIHDQIVQKMTSVNSQNVMVELGRLAAMLNLPSDLLAQSFFQQIDPEFWIEDSPDKIGVQEFDDLLSWTQNTQAVSDLYWLTCFVQLEKNNDHRVLEALANYLFSIDSNFQQQKVKTDSHFRPMLDELASRAFKKYPELSKRLLNEKGFGAAYHGYLFSEFSDDDLPLLQQIVMAWVQENPGKATSDHVQLLARTPTAKTSIALRELAKNRSLQDEVTLAMTRCGDVSDLRLFTEGLKSLSPTVQKQSAIAIRKLVPDVSADVAANALQAAMRLGNEKQDVSIRDQLILLLRKFADKEFGYQLSKPELRQGDVLLQWRAFLIEQQPELADVLKPAETGQQQLARLEKLDWESGEAGRGKQVYEKLQCAACHGTGRALGPRLEGVTNRLTQNDLLMAIVNPDAQVSDRYRTTLFETVDGQLVSGTVVYDNVDGVTVRESSGKTVRLNRDQIEMRRRSAKSMMPSGLLDQATDQEVVDLLSFLKTL